MPSPTLDEPDAAAPGSPQRFEVLLAVGLLSFGLIVLPALIYLTGMVLLGEYSGGTHIGSFFGDFARDLAGGSVRAWSLVLGPYLLVQVGRLIFVQFGAKGSEARPRVAEPTPKPPTGKSRSQVPERREPTFKI